MPVKFEVGDIICNKYGHVLAIGKIEDDGWILCFYQTDPSGSYSKYKSEDLRLLSKTKGVEVGGDPFMETIRRCLEASGRVVKTTKKREERDPEEEELLRGLTKEELKELLVKARTELSFDLSNIPDDVKITAARLEGVDLIVSGEKDSKIEEDSSK